MNAPVTLGRARPEGIGPLLGDDRSLEMPALKDAGKRQRASVRRCHSCRTMSEMAEDGTCLECLSIIDLTLWQETEEAWASDARPMEAEELAPRVIVWDFTK